MKCKFVKGMPWAFVMLVFFVFGTAGPGYAFPVKWDLDMVHRNDNLRWNIAGDSNGANPNVLSELTWTKIETWPAEARLTVGLLPRLDLQARGEFAFINRGNVQDSDYNGDNRTLEFSRSNNETAGDILYGLGGVIILQGIRTPYWTVSGKLGYSREAQNFRMTNGFQTIPDAGPFPGLNSTYQATWHGPLLGLESVYRGHWLDMSCGVAYHWATYYGQGDWNLRDNLAHPISFFQQATGNGWQVDLGLALKPAQNWRLRLNLQTSLWRAGPGLDQVLANDGSTIDTLLNEVVWNNMVIDCRAEWHIQDKAITL